MHWAHVVRFRDVRLSHDKVQTWCELVEVEEHVV